MKFIYFRVFIQTKYCAITVLLNNIKSESEDPINIITSLNCEKRK